MIAFQTDGERAAIDVVFRSLDQLMKDDRFREIDDALATIDATSIPSDVLIAILTITFVPRRQLPSRPPLFEATRLVLQGRGEDADSTLRGLR